MKSAYFEIIRLEVLPCPSGIASHVGPAVVLLVRSTRVNVEVYPDGPALRSAMDAMWVSVTGRKRTYRAAPAEHLPSRICQLAAAEATLRHGTKVPCIL